MDPQLVIQLLILVGSGAAAWANIRYRIACLEDEVRRQNGRITRLETTKLPAPSTTPRS